VRSNVISVYSPTSSKPEEAQLRVIKEDILLGLNTLPLLHASVLEKWLKTDFGMEIHTTTEQPWLFSTNPRFHMNIPVIVPGTLAALINLSAFEEVALGKHDIEMLYEIIGGATETIRRLKFLVDSEFTRLGDIIESIGDGIIVIDPDWNITMWNRASVRISGWTKEETLGKPLQSIVKLVNERDRTERLAFINETMRLGRVTSMEDDIVMITKDGRDVPVGDSAAPIFSPNGKLLGVIIVFRDTSKEHELKKAREEFVSFATHQLRAPITIISGYSNILLGHCVQKKGSGLDCDAVQQIDYANKRLRELVNTMLQSLRIDMGMLAVVPESTDLNSAIMEVVNEFSPLAATKNVHFNKELLTTLPSVSFDRNLIHAVIQNFLSNAIKYTAPGGQITVATEVKESNVVIRIQDTGCGIPQSVQSEVFNKMFRADNAQQIDPEGMGLGLYIVKAIVDQSGGTIEFTSEEGKGTTFFVTFPLSGMKQKEGFRGLT
jgi:PAS domain S-box-containing protein